MAAGGRGTEQEPRPGCAEGRVVPRDGLACGLQGPAARLAQGSRTLGAQGTKMREQGPGPDCAKGLCRETGMGQDPAGCAERRAWDRIQLVVPRDGQGTGSSCQASQWSAGQPHEEELVGKNTTDTLLSSSVPPTPTGMRLSGMTATWGLKSSPCPS